MLDKTPIGAVKSILENERSVQRFGIHELRRGQFRWRLWNRKGRKFRSTSNAVPRRSLIRYSTIATGDHGEQNAVSRHAVQEGHEVQRRRATNSSGFTTAIRITSSRKRRLLFQMNYTPTQIVKRFSLLGIVGPSAWSVLVVATIIRNLCSMHLQRIAIGRSVKPAAVPLILFTEQM